MDAFNIAVARQRRAPRFVDMGGGRCYQGEGETDAMSEPHVHEQPTSPASSSGSDGPLALTDVAIEHFRSVMAKEDLGPEFGVRIAVNSGGCSGMSYALSFEREARPDDTVLVQHGLKLFVDRESAPYLAGVTVDYVVGLTKEGFKFINPKASRTCGCGESFGV